MKQSRDHCGQSYSLSCICYLSFSHKWLLIRERIIIYVQFGC